MSADVNIIKALSKRKMFDQLRSRVPDSMLSPDTVSILSWVDLYFKTYTEDTAIDWVNMDSLLTLRGAEYDKGQLDVLKLIMRRVQNVPDTSAESTATLITELAASGEIAALAKKYQDGAEIDFLEELGNVTKKYRELAGTQSKLLEYEDASIDEVLKATEESGGLKLRMLPTLHDRVRGLRGGDTIAVAAPVDAGKTSFLAELAIDLVNQVKEDPLVYGDRPLLWLVNESVAIRTVSRVYQAATHWTIPEIALAHSRGEFEPAYLAKVGRKDMIRIKDAHQMTVQQIRVVMEEMNPFAVIVDMPANLKGGSSDNSESQNLESIWQELRNFGCELDSIMIGTMQFSVDGYNELYPPLTALKQSKVGVQGALDLAIFLGRLNANEHPNDYNIRGISTPKNKLALSGKQGENQFIVEFDGSICKFTEVSINSGD